MPLFWTTLTIVIRIFIVCQVLDTYLVKLRCHVSNRYSILPAACMFRRSANLTWNSGFKRAKSDFFCKNRSNSKKKKKLFKSHQHLDIKMKWGWDVFGVVAGAPFHILTSSVIYYWTDARQHRIYLFYSIKKWKSQQWRYLWVCPPIDHR